MRYTWLFANLFLLTGIILAQASDTVRIEYENGGSVLLRKLGTTRIYLKDNTIRKNCTIKEIKDYWIVFLKDRSLHDVMIDKVKYIEMEDEVHAVFFDDKNKPVIKTIHKYPY